MWNSWWVFAGIVAILALILTVFLRLLRQKLRQRSLPWARETFHRRREWLEARFVTLASQGGKPRGLEWVDCEFENEVSFARHKPTGCLRALVGVSIRFRAVEGGGMEDVEAVGNLKAATVVFRLDGPEWEPDGRAYFNLSPSQTIEHQGLLETAE